MPEPPQLDEFLDRFDEFRKIPIIRQHFAPMVRFLGIRPGFYDQIFNIRQLDEMVEYCAKHGANLTVPHEQTGGPRIQASDLTAGMKKKIVRHYRWDYRIYGKHIRSGQ